MNLIIIIFKFNKKNIINLIIESFENFIGLYNIFLILNCILPLFAHYFSCFSLFHFFEKSFIFVSFHLFCVYFSNFFLAWELPYAFRAQKNPFLRIFLYKIHLYLKKPFLHLFFIFNIWQKFINFKIFNLFVTIPKNLYSFL